MPDAARVERLPRRWQRAGGQARHGQGYAVLGADSVALSRAALSKELGKQLSDEDTRKLLAQDSGVDERQLVVVEQPGDFHIDMHMSLLPGGKAVVNDASAVFALQKQWLTEDLARSKPTPPAAGASAAVRARYDDAKALWDISKEGLPGELAELERAARGTAEAEARMIRDLEKGGVKVERLPGVFPASHGLERMNFLNLEQGQNQKGEHFIVALGGDARAEKRVAERLAAATGAARSLSRPRADAHHPQRQRWNFLPHQGRSVALISSQRTAAG